MKLFGRILATGVLAFFIAGSALAVDTAGLENATVIKRDIADDSDITQMAATKSSDDAMARYNCNLKVYMVEKESRYKDNTNYYHYDNGFLAFAFDTALSLAYLETFQQTKIWDARALNFANNIDSQYLREDNMMAIAVVFSDEDGGTEYSDPWFDARPDGAPFTIHVNDACAAAMHGSPGYDTAYDSYTHTVFIEETTAYT